MRTQDHKFQQFFNLHYKKEPLILLNVWDVISAKVFENAGAQAIATSSAAIAVSLGYPDGEKLPFSTLIDTVKRINSHIKIPLSIDFEAGYTKNVNRLTNYIEQLIEAGVVGINIEDRYPNTPDQLMPANEHANRIQSIKNHIEKSNEKLFINARTDTYWAKHIKFEDRKTETLNRLRAYESAGADGLFIPGLNDFDYVSRLTDQLKKPINILGDAKLNYEKAKNSGVKRISIGSLPLRFIATKLLKLSNDLLNHADFSEFCDIFSYEQLNQLTER